jgi:hypothetical protein
MQREAKGGACSLSLVRQDTLCTSATLQVLQQTAMLSNQCLDDFAQDLCIRLQMYSLLSMEQPTLALYVLPTP